MCNFVEHKGFQEHGFHYFCAPAILTEDNRVSDDGPYPCTRQREG